MRSVERVPPSPYQCPSTLTPGKVASNSLTSGRPAVGTGAAFFAERDAGGGGRGRLVSRFELVSPFTEEAAKAQGLEVRIGRFPFIANARSCSSTSLRSSPCSCSVAR